MRSRRALALALVYVVLGAAWGGACAASGDDPDTSASSEGAGTSVGGAGSSVGGAGSTVGTGGASATTGAGATGGGAASTGSSGGGTGGAASSSTASGAGGMGGDPSGSGGFGGACAAVSAQAQTGPVPADIIIAVDTSGSMDLESGEVQQNLNAFASIITSSGIDAHVVLIADGSVCIPAPLGSGNCASDEQLPAYRHVLVGVSSNDALEKILSTYPQYSASLRPQATKTFLVVSDDESNLSAAQFTSQIVALDPTFQGFKFDAIVSFEDPVTCETACLVSGCTACGKCCPFCFPISAAEGTVYEQLVQQTGGTSGDLCDQDFDAVFQDMATQIVMTTPVACDFDIPPPPNMMAIDPTKVNVVYTPGGMGNPQTIPNVADQAACGALGGWYYDDPVNPTKVLLCPATCTVISGDPTAQVDVEFGCETIHM